MSIDKTCCEPYLSIIYLSCFFLGFHLQHSKNNSISIRISVLAQKRYVKEMTKMIIPAKMPGCAKKLAVRSSLLSIMNTSFPVGVLLCSIGDDGLPVSGPLPGRSKSISFPSPPLMTSVSVSGCDLMSDFYKTM